MAEFANADGGEGLDAGVGILEEGEEGCGAGLVRSVAEGAGGLGANFGVRIGGESGESGGEFDTGGGRNLRFGAGDLTEAPEGVDAGELLGVLEGGFGQDGGGAEALAGEGKLGGLADAGVGVGQEAGEFLERTFVHAFAEEFAGFEDAGGVDVVGFEDVVEAAFAGSVEESDPVADVRTAGDAELDVGGGDAPQELMEIEDFEGGAARLLAERPDASVGAEEVANKEMAGVAFGHAGAGVVGKAGGALGDVGNGWDDVGGGVGVSDIPNFFGVPGAEGNGEAEMLVADAPAVVAAFDEVQPTRLVAEVGVVVAGEEVAEVVEGEFLRVAEAGGEDFEVAAVGVAAEDGARIGVGDDAAGGFDMGAAVADGVVEFAVGSEAEAVEVVAEITDAQAVAEVEGLALVGATFAGGVLEQPEVGEVGEPDIAVAGEDVGGESVEDGVEAVGEDGGVVGMAVLVAVFEEADAVAVLGEEVGLAGHAAANEGFAVVDGPAGEVFVEPGHASADVHGAGGGLEAFVHAEDLDDEEAALLIDGEGDGMGEEGFGGEEGDLEAGGGLEALDGGLAFVGGFGDFGCVNLRPQGQGGGDGRGGVGGLRGGVLGAEQGYETHDECRNAAVEPGNHGGNANGEGDGGKRFGGISGGRGVVSGQS